MVVEAFLKRPGVIFDVRSPAEFREGHIPGAINLPLFSDEERAKIGTVYHKEGKENAVSLAWDIVSPKVFRFIESIEKHLAEGIAKVHCSRGGMRSQSMAELFRLCGVDTLILKGGYKSYRTWCNDLFSNKYPLHVLGGLTGTGKTKILQALKESGGQVIDLEGLANHRGSAFGTLGFVDQPSTEQFHNLIAWELFKCDPKQPIWIEDESRTIGSCHIPEALFLQMRKSPLFLLERPLEKRLENLRVGYGDESPERFIEGVKKLQRKLGGSNTKTIIDHIENGRYAEAAKMVLSYYDSAYLYDLSKRKQQGQKLNFDSLRDEQAAEALLSIFHP